MSSKGNVSIHKMNWTGACVTVLSIEYQFISMSDVILSQRILMCVCNPLTTVAKMSKLLHEKTQINKTIPVDATQTLGL